MASTFTIHQDKTPLSINYIHVHTSVDPGYDGIMLDVYSDYPVESEILIEGIVTLNSPTEFKQSYSVTLMLHTTVATLAMFAGMSGDIVLIEPTSTSPSSDTVYEYEQVWTN